MKDSVNSPVKETMQEERNKIETESRTEVENKTVSKTEKNLAPSFVLFNSGFFLSSTFIPDYQTTAVGNFSC